MYEVRNKEIYALRKDGRTLKEIANHYGMSRENVRRIIEKVERVEHFPKLCHRTNNVLAHHGITTDEQLTYFAKKYGWKIFAHMRSCGKGTVDEIANYLKPSCGDILAIECEDDSLVGKTVRQMHDEYMKSRKETT